MTGLVNEYLRILVTLDIRESVEPYSEQNFVLDTGYTGSLTLPDDLIRRLGLTRFDEVEMIQANGDKLIAGVYLLRIVWNEQEKVVAAEGDPLLGMELLNENRITIEARYGGSVLIESIERGKGN